MKAAAKEERKPLLRRAAWRTVAPLLLRGFVFKMLWLAAAVVSNAIVLRQLIQYIEDGSTDEVLGFGLAIAFVGSELLKSIFVNSHWLLGVLAGVQLRGAARLLIYRKALKVQAAGASVGSTMNLVANDAQRLLESMQYFMFLVSAPLTSVVVLAVMWLLLGPSVLAGFAAMLLVLGVGLAMGRYNARIRRATVKITDRRVRLMNELLNGIKLVKLYAWEGAFAEKVQDVRQQETSSLVRAAYALAVNNVVAFATPVLVVLVTFVTYTFTQDEPLKASDAFAIVGLFAAARFPLNVAPIAVKNASEALVGLQRMQAFLELPEVRESDKPDKLPGAAAGEGGVAIQLHDACFRWHGSASLRSASKDGTGEGNEAAEEAVVPEQLAAAGEGTTPVCPSEAFALRDITLSVPRGALLAVVGPVGAGKSSLLSALLGSLERQSGSSAMVDSVTYCAQAPWVYNATVRDNVVFASSLDEARYARAVHACALDADLAQLPAGSDTEVGEKGVTLSGGQKARLALARSVYSDKQVLLLDDPLSAVDVHVGKHMWRHALGPHSVTAGRTRVLVTHQVQFLPEADLVVVVQGGRIAAQGTYDELLAAGVDFRQLVEDVAADEDEEDAVSVASGGGAKSRGGAGDVDPGAVAEPLPGSSSGKVTLHAVKLPVATNGGEAGDSAGTASAPRAQASVAPMPPSGPMSVVTTGGISRHSEAGEEDGGDRDSVSKPTGKTGSGAAAGGRGALMKAEEVGTGAVAISTVVQYATNAGASFWAVVVPLLFALAQASRIVSDYMLTVWLEDNRDARQAGLEESDNADTNLSLYAGTAGGMLLVNLVVVCLFAMLTLRASRVMHRDMFAAVLRAPAAFFDTTPLGRILQRFAADMDIVDVALPTVLQNCLSLLLQCVLSLVLIAVIFPYFLIALVLVMAAFLTVARYFRRTVRQLKRIENVTRSPVFSTMSATMHGLSTIRAHGETARYLHFFEERIDRNSAAYFNWYAANRWVGVRLDSCVIAVSFSIAILSVVAARAGSIAPSRAALALTYSLQMGGILQYSTRLMMESESMFTSVERLTQYSQDIAQENPVLKPHLSIVVHSPNHLPKGGQDEGEGTLPEEAVLPPGTLDDDFNREQPWHPRHWDSTLTRRAWPERGAVSFRGVTVRYRAELPLVLRDVSFEVNAGWKVGIVGRTGSGKSSLGLTLFRLLEAEQGSIRIDDVDIAGVNLHQLRSGLSVIPQDPFMMIGSIRYNLTPFGKHSDEEVWTALQHSGLHEYVAGLPGQLEYAISEGGGNISQGQRQLFCLARALLRRSRVVLLDEATSSVDKATDDIIQRSVREHLAGSTLLIVAHRLDTIAGADRILCLEGGRVKAYAHPAQLLGVVPGAAVGGNGGGGNLFKDLVHQMGAEGQASIEAAAAAAWAGAARDVTEGEL